MLPNFEEHLNELRRAVEAFPWSEKMAYACYLAQTYYYVTHSTRLLALAAGHMSEEDRVFHRRFLEHAAEEKGHESVVLKDLKTLGFELAEFPELAETLMFWEPQYFKIQHKDPMALMGYILALEAIATDQCPVITETLAKSYPAGTYNFIRIHGEDDPSHVEKAWQQIKSLDKTRLHWVEQNFRQTVVGFCRMLAAAERESRGHYYLKTA